MQTTLINLTTSNPSLSALAGRQYKPGYTPVPDCKLPLAIQQSLQLMFRTLTGRELPIETSSTLLVNAPDGTFKRLYGPSVFRRAKPEPGESSLFIKWGSEKIDLIDVKGGITTKQEPLEDGSQPPLNDNLMVAFAEVDYGRGKDIALQFQLVDDVSDSLTVFDVAVRFVSYDPKPDLNAINLLAKKRRLKELAELIAEEPSGTGGGQYGDPVNLRDLELGEYSVFGYRPVKTQYGPKFIIQVEAQPLLGRDSQFEVWADKNTVQILSAIPSPKITSDSPAILRINDKVPTSDGKIKVNCSFILSSFTTSAGGLDLDFN